jgi:hypothetical protein
MADETKSNGHDKFVEAQRLAEANLGRCHGPCRQVKTLTELVTVFFRDTVATSICPECFEIVDLVISMTAEGLNLKLIRKASVVVVG